MKRSDFRFTERLRVRWAEVDMQKIVFNGHYLMYIDTAVAGYWRALALPYHETMDALQGDLFVRKATLEYEGSARYDERLDVGVRCARLGNSSMVLSAAVFRGEQRLVHGELVYVFADPVTQTSRVIPAPLRALLEAFEAGEGMIELRLGDWATLGTDARPIRHAVFVAEQGLPSDLVEDADDAAAVQLLAFNRLGAPVACGRLVPRGDGSAQIGRMATLPGIRASGFGRQMVDALLSAARAHGHREVQLQSAIDAVPMYLRAGFVAIGPVFEEAGLPHQTMRQALAAAQPTGSKTSR